MTKIRIFSDLHLEFGPFEVTEMPDDSDTILILAGDINPTYALHRHQAADKSTAALFDSITGRFKKVLYVAGNHCLWGKTYDHSIQDLREFCKGYDDIEFLERDMINIDGIDFFGTTMWTNADRANPIVIETIKRGMNDFGKIKDFSPQEMIKVHEESREWLTKSLINCRGKSVIITHHMPSFQCVAPQYMHNKHSRILNHAYYSDLEDIMHSFNPLCWIFGHSHTPMDFKIENTRLINNARGYTGYEAVPKFNPELIIEV